MNDNRQQQPYGNGWSGAAGWGGAMGPWSPMIMPWMEMMRVWASTMSSFVPGAPAMAGEWMNQFVPGTFPVGAGSPVSVHVSSHVPVDVTVDLAPTPDTTALRVEPLTCTSDKAVPPLVAVRLERPNGLLRVRLTVPNDQPAGAYRGAVVDANGTRRGEIRVQVEGRQESSPGAP